MSSSSSDENLDSSSILSSNSSKDEDDILLNLTDEDEDEDDQKLESTASINILDPFKGISPTMTKVRLRRIKELKILIKILFHCFAFGLIVIAVTFCVLFPVMVFLYIFKGTIPFEPPYRYDSREFHEELLYKGLYYSTVTYCKIEEVENWDCVPCENHFPYLKSSKVVEKEGSDYDSYGFIHYDPDLNLIVVSFRGTRNRGGGLKGLIKNWITNLSVKKKIYKDFGKVHKGFYRAYEKMKEDVFTEIDKLIYEYPNAQIFINGYSSGGALAILTSFDLLLERNINSEQILVYVYGVPRVGNELFVKFYHEFGINCFRAVHDDDIVPHSPPRRLGFRHVGTEVWFERTSLNYKVCKRNIEDTECSNSLGDLDYDFDRHKDYMLLSVTKQC